MITRAQARKCEADLEKNAQQKTAAPIKTASILGVDHKQPDKNEHKKKSGQSKINKQESRQNVASKKNEKSDSTEGQFRRAESTQNQAKLEHNDQRSTATSKHNSTSATKLIGSNSSPVSDSVASCKAPKQREEPPVYISPFVTLTRGKHSARKESQARTSKAGADHFTPIVDAEIIRLEKICVDWSNYKEQKNPPEEAVSMIDCAIGQTNLLINKKFVQFRGLIEKCKMEGPTAGGPVTCEDLHGFWDMVYIQVENIEKRFDNLANLRENNWKEVIPVPKKTSKKRGKSSVSPLVKSAKARISSPGLVMMKVTQHLKILDTPTKGILKTNGSKSARKNILTIEPPEEMSKENNANIPTPSRLSPKVNIPKRSARLRKQNYFNLII